MYLRVITIADLTEETGRYIPDGVMDGKGEWIAGSDLKWLDHQPNPPKRSWEVFRKCLKLTFCSKVPQ